MKEGGFDSSTNRWVLEDNSEIPINVVGDVSVHTKIGHGSQRPITALYGSYETKLEIGEFGFVPDPLFTIRVKTPSSKSIAVILRRAQGATQAVARTLGRCQWQSLCEFAEVPTPCRRRADAVPKPLKLLDTLAIPSKISRLYRYTCTIGLTQIQNRNDRLIFFLLNFYKILK